MTEHALLVPDWPRSRTAPVAMVDAALDLAALGWPVFPLQPRGKEPLISRDAGGRGHDDATTDRATICAWWARCPHANIGLRPDGAIVIDVDPRHDGDRALVRLVREHGPLGETMHAETGSGGDHFFFRLGDKPVRHGSNVLGRGIDTRVDRKGYVVAPPSVHPETGERYQWVSLREPAPLPSWLGELLAPRPVETPPAPPRREDTTDAIERARAWLARVEPAVQGQNGSTRTMFAAVGLVRGFALDPRVALELLLADFNPRCVPPWSRREMEHKVASAERSPKPVGYLLNQPRRNAA